MHRGKLLAALVVTAALAVPSQAAATSAGDDVGPGPQGLNLEQVPARLSASNGAVWWQPLDHFRDKTYFAYGAVDEGGRHVPEVAVRDRDGNWHVGCLKTADGSECVSFPDDFGHNQSSIAVDGDGYIHVFASMHSSRWQYFRSTSPEDVTTMVDRSSEMPDQDRTYTYPVTDRAPNGDVYVIVRADERGGYRRVNYRAGGMYRWDDRADSWSAVGEFARAEGYAVYPDDIKIDSRGRVHLLYEWAGYSSSAKRHLPGYMIHDPRRGTYESVSGERLTIPVGPTETADISYQPLSPGESPTSKGLLDPGVQGAKFALDSRGNLGGIAYRYKPTTANYEVRLATWNGREWKRETVYAGARPTTPGVDISVHGRTTRVYYAKQRPCSVQAVVAERHPHNWGRWVYGDIGNGQNIPRPAVDTTRNGTDILYLSDVTAVSSAEGKLWYGELRHGRPIDGSTEQDTAADYPPPPSGTDVAAGGSATASSEAGSNVAARAVDGNMNTFWTPVPSDDARFLEVAWDTPKSVNSVTISSGRPGAEDTTWTLKDFTVSLHHQGTWTEVGNFVGNGCSTLVVPLDEPVQADKVRLTISTFSPNPRVTDHGVQELKVYSAG